MTREEVKVAWNSLTERQKAEAEKVFRDKREQLLSWYAEEEKRTRAKLKVEGRFRTGLDANSGQIEVRELSAEYHRRFEALPEECIRAIKEQNIG